MSSSTNNYADRIRYQFSMKSVLFAMTIFCIAAASFTSGFYGFLMFTLPVIVARYFRKPIMIPDCSKSAWQTRTIVAAFFIGLASAATAWLSLGQPCNLSTWLWILSPGAWFWLSAHFVNWWRKGLLLICTCSLVAFPFLISPTWIGIDIRRGMIIYKYIFNLEYVYCNVNKSLIVSYCGYRSANIFYSSGRVRFPADYKSLVFDECLDDVLNVLPNDVARTQVLLCLTDANNDLRHYQATILALVYERGYPKGLNASDWWDKQQKIFIPTKDPSIAAQRIHDWDQKLKEILENDVMFEFPNQSLACRQYYTAVHSYGEMENRISTDELLGKIMQIERGEITECTDTPEIIW